MARQEELFTTVSTKGQVILPKALRERRHWNADTKLIARETDEGVLLTRAPAFTPTRPDNVFGVLPKPHKPVSAEDMDAAVRAEARRRA